MVGNTITSSKNFPMDVLVWWNFSRERDIIDNTLIANSAREDNMAVTYKKLFHMLIDRDMTPSQLQQQAGYSANISTRLRRDTYISLESVEKICKVLNCKVDDIVEFIPDSSSKD